MSEEEDRARARLGSVLNEKWTLEALLGVGGMAAVYAARHRNGARGGVKILHPELARHEEVQERFRREGYAANRVEHPGAVKVLDDDVVSTGPDAGAAYLVMELLEGSSLQERLERGPPVGEREFLVIASAVLDVLEAAHARGVVHRDIKPENLFLLRDTRASEVGVRIKVLDFGLARLLEAQSITTHGLALGTPSFMSPEQAGGKVDEVDGRADLFSLAATGFRLITGARIHEGVGAVELVTKMAQLPAPPIRSVAPHVSEPFARVIDRALSFRREDRYPSATLMRADVEKAIAELDEAGRTVELSSSALEPAFADTQLPPPPIIAPAPSKRRSVVPMLFFIALAAAAMTIIVEPRVRGRALALVAPPPPASASAAATASASAPAPTPASATASASAAIVDVPPRDAAATATPEAAPPDDAATAALDAGIADDAAADDASDDAAADAPPVVDASPVATARPPPPRPVKRPNARPVPRKHHKR